MIKKLIKYLIKLYKKLIMEQPTYFTDTALTDLIDALKILVQDPVTPNKFAHITGTKVDNYIKAKLLTLLGASKKLLRVNAANDGLEGKTFEELVKEVIGNNKIIFRNSSGVVEEVSIENFLKLILTTNETLIYRDEVGNITSYTFEYFIKKILTTNEKIMYRDSSGNIVQISLPAYHLPSYYISGHGLTGTIVNIIVQPGACRNAEDTEDLYLKTAMTKLFTAWVVGSGNGGLDTGAGLAANTIYYIYQIFRDDTEVEDILISLSNSTPNLPTDYTDYRIIGSFATDKDAVIALSTLFNHETYYEFGVNGTPYDFNYNSEIKIDYKDFQTIEIKEMYCRDSANLLNINIFQKFLITTNTTGSGGNLIDAALLVNTQYYIYLATKNDGIDTTAYISDSLSPSFPAGYDFTRMIGAFKTETLTTNIDVNTLTADEKANGAFEGNVINVQENLTQGTNGGSATTTTWIARNLTTVNKNTIPTAVMSTATDKITLPPGTYDAHITQAISRIDVTGRLYDSTGAVSLLRFTQNDNANQQGNSLICVGRFELSVQSDIEIQYYANTSVGTTDLGEALNIAGLQEQYLQATFIKVK